MRVIVAVAFLQVLLIANCAIADIIKPPPPEFCWRDTQTRGVGTIPSQCSREKERIGALCYTRCPAGSSRIAFDCYTTCPGGFRDDGLFCRLAEYGRGAGYPWRFGDPLNDDGMIRRCEVDNGAGNCEKYLLMYYPKCKPGYSAVGCCICRPNTPNCGALGLGARIDLSCAKKIKQLGDPTPMVCPPSEDTEAGLCYRKCRQGYTGIGPVCWGLAPKGWVECGMGAATDSLKCASIVWDQVSSVANLALNVLTFGSSAAISKATTAAANMERLTKLKQAFTQMQQALKKADKIKAHVEKYADSNREVGRQADSVTQAMNVNFDDMTEADIVRMVASIAAFVDPTGVASTIVAYSYPKCGAIRV